MKDFYNLKSMLVGNNKTSIFFFEEFQVTLSVIFNWGNHLNLIPIKESNLLDEKVICQLSIPHNHDE